MFFLAAADKKRQCYPLCFFGRRLIKSDSVTPYVLICGNRKKASVTPYAFLAVADKKRQCYPLRFFWRRLIKSDSVTPYVFFGGG